MWFKIISQLNNSDQISLPRLSIRASALLLKRFRRREAELFPSRHVQLPCLSARLNRSLMEPSTRLDAPPMFLADRRWRPRTIEKLPHNFAETLNFLLIGQTFALNAYLVFGADRDVVYIPRQVFRCHAIRRSLGAFG
jgi:hypothetical protein